MVEVQRFRRNIREHYVVLNPEIIKNHCAKPLSTGSVPDSWQTRSTTRFEGNVQNQVRAIISEIHRKSTWQAAHDTGPSRFKQFLRVIYISFNTTTKYPQ